MTQLLDRPPGTPPLDLPRVARVPIGSHAERPRLSVRQLVVAVMTADGSTCRDIAVALSLPLRTVQGHLYNALRILDLPDAEALTRELIAAHRASSAQAVIGQSMQAVAGRSGPATALDLELAITRVELERQRVIEKQLQRALASRDSIGQAKGILMERYKISAEAAFAVLERESSRSNRKLVDVVECLLFSGEPGQPGGRQERGG